MIRREETINEKIRNKVAPFKMLIDLVESKGSDDEYTNLVVSSCKESMNALLKLGMRSIEPDDSIYYMKSVSESSDIDELKRISAHFGNVWTLLTEGFSTEQYAMLIEMNPIFSKMASYKMENMLQQC